MPRLLKQALYGAFYILVWTGVIFAVRYAFRPPPAPPGLPVENLSALSGVQIFNATSGTSFLIQIKNPNADYAAKNFTYILHITNASGTASELRDSGFIYASEIKYLVWPNALPGKNSIMHADLELQSPQWVRTEIFPRPDIVLSGFNATSTAAGVMVKGQVQNRESVRLSRADLVALFYAHGKVSAVSQTRLDNIAAGESRAFSIFHPQEDGLDLVATQVFVYGLK